MCPIGLLEDEAKLLQTKFRKKNKSTVLVKQTLAAATWQIWKERNARILKNKEQIKILVFRRLYEDVGVLLKTCNWRTDRLRTMRATFKLECIIQL